jgi:hypothetical protein
MAALFQSVHVSPLDPWKNACERGRAARAGRRRAAACYPGYTWRAWAPSGSRNGSAAEHRPQARLDSVPKAPQKETLAVAAPFRAPSPRVPAKRRRRRPSCKVPMALVREGRCLRSPPRRSAPSCASDGGWLGREEWDRNRPKLGPDTGPCCPHADPRLIPGRRVARPHDVPFSLGLSGGLHSDRS